MRKSRLGLVAALCLGFTLHAQELALTAAQKEHILRGGVLALYGSRLPGLTAAERAQLATNVKTSGATYVRWLGYFWTGVPKIDEPTDYDARWNAYYSAFATTAGTIRAASPNVYLEFAIPELVTAEVSKINLASPENQAIAAFIKEKTGVVLPAKFDFTAIRQDKPQHGRVDLPDYVWSCFYNPDEGGCGTRVFIKNGVPSLSKPQGKAWMLYLAARAIKAGSGANGFFIAATRDGAATNPWRDLADMIAKIRQMKPDAIVGTSALSAFPLPPTGIVPNKIVDFTKTFLDIDSYRTSATGVRTVAPAFGSTTRVPCYTLSAAENATYLPADNNSENLCIVHNAIGRRPVKAGQSSSIGRNQIEYNPFKLPILLEYDPANTSCGPIYEPNTSGLSSPCDERIRHALSVSMIFPISTSPVRQRYIQYAYRLARKLTHEKGFPVYAFGWLDYGEGLEIRKAWDLADTDPKYVEQKKLIRMMPAGKDDTGVLVNGKPPRAYVVHNVQGDLDALAAAIHEVLTNP